MRYLTPTLQGISGALSREPEDQGPLIMETCTTMLVLHMMVSQVMRSPTKKEHYTNPCLQVYIQH